MIPRQVRDFIEHDRENKQILKPVKQVTMFSLKKIIKSVAITDSLIVLAPIFTILIMYLHFTDIHTATRFAIK